MRLRILYADGSRAEIAILGVTAYWGKEALDAFLPAQVVDNLKATMPKFAPPTTFIWPFLVIVLHTIIFLALTYGLLRWKSTPSRP